MTDLGRFHELGERLLSSLGDRLSAGVRADLGLYLWEEEALMVNDMASVLVQDQVPVDRAERDMVAEMLGHFSLEELHPTFYRRIRDRDATLAALNVVDEL